MQYLKMHIPDTVFFVIDGFKVPESLRESLSTASSLHRGVLSVTKLPLIANFCISSNTFVFCYCYLFIKQQ